MMVKYCVDCHSSKKPKGELNLAAISDEATALKSRKVWVEIQKRVHQREMPPEDAPQPSSAEIERLSNWAAATVKRIDAATPPQPGRVTMRRLNRVEYRNTIHDLLGVTFDLGWDPTRDFPADGAGYGFDNIGDVLTTSPLHLEKYLAAAQEILDRAVVVEGLDGPRQRKFAPDELRVVSPKRPQGNLGMWPTKWIAELEIRQAGEYRVKAVLRTESNNGKQSQMAIQTDGSNPDRFTITRQGKAITTERKINIARRGLVQVWVEYQHEQNKPLFEPADAANGMITVESLEISGPYFDLAKLPDSHRQLIIARPASDQPRAKAAEEILAAFLPKAFRRAVPTTELRQYVALFEKADAPSESFEGALQIPLQAALVSPHFLYRIEQDPIKNSAAYVLNPYELASRLSYFLWASMPDEELFSAARAGSLTQTEVLEKHTRRMLADPKSSALAENFVTQWLQIRRLDTFQPHPKVGKIGTQLRNGMLAEPVLLFHHALTAHRPITDLLDANFTFANEELAKLYKLPLAPEHREGSKERDRLQIVRYSLPAESRRGGLMTTAAVLIATSHPDRTSPVKRGKWVLDALLGAPPPPPPPTVEALADAPASDSKISLRERLEQHRQNTTCASCHQRMDPLGFAFENYDALGRWRDKEGNLAINASAKLPNGTAIDGVVGLKSYLLKEQDAFARNLTEKLLTYALGRGVEPFDGRVVDNIVAATNADGAKLSRIVVGIVSSSPFRQRMAAGKP